MKQLGPKGEGIGGEREGDSPHLCVNAPVVSQGVSHPNNLFALSSSGP